MRFSISRFVPAAILSLLLPSAAAQQPRVELRQAAARLASPVSMTHANDARLFVTLQGGQIVIFDGVAVASTPFLDIRSIVSCCGERGLLSVAFHPRYHQNGFFYVYYTDLQGDLVIARYSVSADRNRADPTSGVILLEIEHQRFANHNGGQLAFGPDGYLYAGTGDGGSGGDPDNNGQNLNSLLGKMLRIDVDGAFPYAIPSSNPFAGRSDARGEIWAYGLRNPWRFSFDRENGDLWIADVGQNLWEEVNHQPAASIGGENYGWRRMEGTHCFNPSTNCQRPDLVLPVIEYSQSGEPCSVTGGYRYRGGRSPSLRGMYIYADFCSGEIWGATSREDGVWISQTLFDAPFPISTFGEDAIGEIYVGDYNGRIFRLMDTSPVLPRRRAVAR